MSYNRAKTATRSFGDRNLRASIYATDAIRSFAIGYFSIIFVIVANDMGTGALGIGIITAASVSSGIVITYFLNRLANKKGAKIPLAISGILMAGTGVVVLFSHSTIELFLAAFLGFLPPSGGLFVAALAEGALAQTPSEERTKVFARNGLIVTASGALGALFAAFPTLLGLNQNTGIQLLTMFYSILGILLSLVALSIIDSVPRSNEIKGPLEPESSSTKSAAHSPTRQGTSSIINRLALLFVADSAGSGIVTPTLIIYWLRVHFGFSVVDLSALFFGIDVLSAVSFPLAVKLSRKIGLLNTAVFTHIPSSILLMAVPFAPIGIVAALLLLSRALLVEMDVPTRQSYIASIVKPQERRSAAARTSMGKQIGRAVGPAIGGTVYASIGAVAPFVIGGLVKISYDLTLWRSFRKVQSREDS